MRSIKNWIALGAFSLLVMGIPTVASAQWGGNGQYDPYGRNGQYDPYGRNGQYDPYGNSNDPYYRNGNYGNSNNAVRNLKSKARDFQRQLDRDLDRNRRVNGSRREDQINELADRFKDAVNDLDNNYYNNNRGYGRNDNQMRRVFDRASDVERAINRVQISYQARNLWNSIRNDLQFISRGYNTYNNGNGRGWGNGRNPNNNRNGLPSWWPF